MICGVYCRVSSAKQGEKFSIPTQINQGIAFATKNGWDFKIYQEAISGATIEARDEFNRLLNDIINGMITKVWVIESSRLSRNLEDAIQIQRIFSQYRIQYFVNDILTDFNSSEKLLSYHIQSAVSQFERTKLTERSIRGKTQWQDSGYLSLPNIYGYDYRYLEKGKKEWFINEEEAKVIHLIFKYYVEDRLPYNQIILKLNDAGILTKKGKYWARSQIRQILMQTLYIGMSWKVDGTPIESKVYPPIVDKDIFDKAQYIIKHTTKKRNKFIARKASNVLSGLLRCDICGAPYFANLVQKTGKDGERREWFKYYHSINHTKYKGCTNKAKGIDKDKIELIFENLVRDEFFENEDKMWAWWKSYQKKTGLRIHELEQAIERYNENKNKIEGKRNKIVEAIADGVMTKEDAKQVLSKLGLEISQIDGHIQKLKAELSDQESQVNNEIYSAITDLTLNFSSIGINQKRELYKMLFKDIRINGQRMVVLLYDDTERKMLIPIFAGRGKRRSA